MDIKWLNAVIDLPSHGFDRVSDFWVEVTATTRGDIHPDHQEFIHLTPESGDMYLELQRLDHGPANVHLDLVVERDQIGPATEEAVEAGATVVATPGHSVLTTPGGVRFCIVPWSGESEQAAVIDVARPHAVDQLCIDVPHDSYEDDSAFWARITGWQPNAPQLPEFRSFAQPASMPIRILLQQLGRDDTAGPRCHLDISSGEHVESVVERHEAAGGVVVERFRYWTMMSDPIGMTYCITSRRPYAF